MAPHRFSNRAMTTQPQCDEIAREHLLVDEEMVAHVPSKRMSRRDLRTKRAVNDSFHTISTKVSLMSKALKKKAHAMYLQFQMHTDAPSTQDPYSRRCLLDDDLSDEEDAHQDASREMYIYLAHNIRRSLSCV